MYSTTALSSLFIVPSRFQKAKKTKPWSKKERTGGPLSLPKTNFKARNLRFQTGRVKGFFNTVYLTQDDWLQRHKPFNGYL
jgi:hypothetical protein